MGQLRIATWNLLGRERPDTDFVGQWLRQNMVDVACLQEVQERQLHNIKYASRLDHANWSFKHWGGRAWPEGLGIVSRYELHHFDAQTISRRAPWWSHHRRIMQSTVLDLENTNIVVVNTHLSSSNHQARRLQLERLLRNLDDKGMAPHVAINGDFNTGPGDNVFQLLAERDMYDTLRREPKRPTNWSSKIRSGAPDQRLDYTWISDGMRIADCIVPKFGDEGFASLAKNSDHLPVVSTLEW